MSNFCCRPASVSSSIGVEPKESRSPCKTIVFAVAIAVILGAVITASLMRSGVIKYRATWLTGTLWGLTAVSVMVAIFARPTCSKRVSQQTPKEPAATRGEPAPAAPDAVIATYIPLDITCEGYSFELVVVEYSSPVDDDVRPQILRARCDGKARFFGWFRNPDQNLQNTIFASLRSEAVKDGMQYVGYTAHETPCLNARRSRSDKSSLEHGMLINNNGRETVAVQRVSTIYTTRNEEERVVDHRDYPFYESPFFCEARTNNAANETLVDVVETDRRSYHIPHFETLDRWFESRRR